MRLLAIDPGTLCMGIALFDGPDLVESQSFVEWGNNNDALLRVNNLMDRLDYLISRSGNRLVDRRIGAIAIEKPGASDPAKRPASLLTLCTAIRQRARHKWKLPLTEYATGTITSKVKLRGDRDPGRKAKLRRGVVALYGPRYQNAPQDIIDAIAVGHTHLCKLRERELTEV